MSDGKEGQASAPDHGGTHDDNPPKAVSGGASSTGGPASQDDPKGEAIPGFDPQDQPDFAYRKPGATDSAGLVSKVVGSLAHAGNNSG